MRELDFSESNLFSRLCGVNTIWRLLQGETKRYVKVRLERALESEIDVRVGCARYVRSEERQDYRNGSYSRDLLTTYGWITGLRVPRVRGGGYESDVFRRYQRRQAVLDVVLLESFLLGHSTRKSRRLFGSLFGESVSAPTVSRVVKHLDEELATFHRRPISVRYRYVYLDGLWVTLRKPVKSRKVILVALGVAEDGTQHLLSFQLAPSESESCWWGFVSDLKSRGLHSPQLVITDGAAGLIKAVQALYPRSDHQRCGVHKAFEAANRVVERRHLRSFRRAALRVFEARNETELRTHLGIFTERWSQREPRAVQGFLRGLDGCLTYLAYPPPEQRRLYNTNLVERYIEEIRRRTIPMRSFNNAKSAERIIYGLIAYVLNQEPKDKPTYQFTQDA